MRLSGDRVGPCDPMSAGLAVCPFIERQRGGVSVQTHDDLADGIPKQRQRQPRIKGLKWLLLPPTQWEQQQSAVHLGSLPVRAKKLTGQADGGNGNGIGSASSRSKTFPIKLMRFNEADRASAHIVVVRPGSASRRATASSRQPAASDQSNGNRNRHRHRVSEWQLL